MKLAREQVEKLTALVLENLKKKNLITFKVPEEQVLGKMLDVFIADLAAEDELDREVDKILGEHSREMDTERVDHRRIFNMIKHKLARERGIIL